ncbi:MAG: hypothetical protein ACRCV3_02845 [Desulfovibrionaceae bacterium]
MDVQNIILLDTLKGWHYIVETFFSMPQRKCIHALSLEQCLGYIEKENIALILYDMIVDVNTVGFSNFLEEIENTGRIIPIVFLVEKDIFPSYKYAFSSVIEKPLHSVVLRSIVHEILCEKI